MQAIGKWAQSTELQLLDKGWTMFIKECHGPSCIHPEIKNLQLPAASYLNCLCRNGVPVATVTQPWTLQQKDDAIHCGSHLLVTVLYCEFLVE